MLKDIKRELRGLPRIEKEVVGLLRGGLETTMILLEGYEESHPEDPSVVKEWLKSAKDDLKVSLQSKEIGAEGLALYHLQQAVEKFAKSFAMLSGVIREKELANYDHNAAKFFIRILENEQLKRILRDIEDKAGEMRRVLLSKKKKSGLYKDGEQKARNLL
jgi:HEPN domain-containing protein